MQAYRDGGNAIDAAIAAAAVLTVVYPHNVALGGDLIALVRTPEGTVRCVNASGWAGAAHRCSGTACAARQAATRAGCRRGDGARRSPWLGSIARPRCSPRLDSRTVGRGDRREDGRTRRAVAGIAHRRHGERRSVRHRGLRQGLPPSRCKPSRRRRLRPAATGRQLRGPARRWARRVLQGGSRRELHVLPPVARISLDGRRFRGVRARDRRAHLDELPVASRC